MTAVLASATARPAPLRRPTPMPIGADAPSAASWAASFVPPPSEIPADTRPVASPADPGPPRLRADPGAEFVKLVLTQWMGALITYEALAATIDRRRLIIPPLGL